MRTKGGRRWETFHLIEAVGWEQDDEGRSRGVSITLPDWLMRAVMDRRVLALDPRYFDMTSGLGRWLYRVARKQAGDNATGWRWTVADLHGRSGVTRPLRSFAADLRKLVAADELRFPSGVQVGEELSVYPALARQGRTSMTVTA